MLYILFCRKVTFKELLYFIFFNHTVAIVLEKVVLLSGVETARDNTVSTATLYVALTHSLVILCSNVCPAFKSSCYLKIVLKSDVTKAMPC